VVQIVAFGLGLDVLLLLAVVRGDLLADWRRAPNDAPNNFLVISARTAPGLQGFFDCARLGAPQCIHGGAHGSPPSFRNR